MICDAKLTNNSNSTQLIAPRFIEHDYYSSTEISHWLGAQDWGAGWSKGGVKGMEAWAKYLADFHATLDYPLTVTVE